MVPFRLGQVFRALMAFAVFTETSAAEPTLSETPVQWEPGVYQGFWRDGNWPARWTLIDANPDGSWSAQFTYRRHGENTWAPSVDAAIVALEDGSVAFSFSAEGQSVYAVAKSRVPTPDGPCLVANMDPTRSTYTWEAGVPVLGLYLDRNLKTSPVTRFDVSEVALETKTEFDLRLWSSEDGLVHNGIRSLAQTPDGYLWVGTINGVSRFDGDTFTNFLPSNAPGLGGTNINQMIVDRRGRLVMTDRETGLYFFEDGSFRPFEHNEALRERWPRSLSEAPNGDLWFTLDDIDVARVTPNGDLKLYRSEDSAWHPFEVYLNQPAITGIFPLADDLWLGTGHGLVRLNPDGMAPREFIFPLLGVWRPMGSGAAPAENIWTIGPASSMARYTPETKTVALTFLSELHPKPIRGWGLDQVLEEDSFHAALQGHLIQYEGSRWYRYELGEASVDGPVFQDDAGNIWFQNGDHGLGRLRPHRVTHLTQEDGLHRDHTRGMAVRPDGIIEIATPEGLLQVSGGDTRFRDLSPWLGPGGASTVLMDPQVPGTRWVGVNMYTRSPGPHDTPALLRVSEEAVTPYFLPENRRGFKQAYSLAWLPEQGPIIATSDGLYALIDGQVLSWTPPDFPQDPGSLWALHTSPGSEALWIGTEKAGVYVLEGSGGRTLSTAQNLNSPSALCFAEGSNGALYIGTSGGLNGILGGEVHGTIGLESPLNLPIHQMVRDQHGALWLGTSEGIVAVNESALHQAWRSGSAPETDILRRLDGLDSETVMASYAPAACQGPDDTLYFSMEVGYAFLDPTKALRHVAAPRVQLEGLRSLDQSFFDETQRHIPNNTPKRLPPRATRLLRFDYSAIDFSAPERTQFRHRLLGLSDQWSKLDTARHTYFPSLPPGAYTFEVSAVNHNHRQSATPASLSFVLRPHFYQTLWFRLGMVGLGFFLALRWRRALLRIKDLERRVALNEERGRIARDMHAEIGSGLAQIRLLGELARQEDEKPQEARRLMGEITDLARQTSQSLREILWTLNPGKASLPNLAAYAHQIVDAFFAESPIQASVHYADLPNRDLNSAHRRELIMILKEIANNTLKHSKASTFSVNFAYEPSEQKLILETRDDGVGFSPDVVPADAQGLSDIRTRVETLQGTLERTTAPGDGTRYRITVQVSTPPVRGIDLITQR